MHTHIFHAADKLAGDLRDCFLNAWLEIVFLAPGARTHAKCVRPRQFHQSFGRSVQRACPASGWLGRQHGPPVSVQAGVAFAAWLFIQGARLGEPLTNALHCGQSDMQRLRIRLAVVRHQQHVCAVESSYAGMSRVAPIQ